MAPGNYFRSVFLGALAIVPACGGVALFPLSYRTDETLSEFRPSSIGLSLNRRHHQGCLSRYCSDLSASATFGSARAGAWLEDSQATGTRCFRCAFGPARSIRRIGLLVISGRLPGNQEFSNLAGAGTARG